MTPPRIQVIVSQTVSKVLKISQGVRGRDGAGVVIVHHTITVLEATSKSFSLAQAPVDPTNVGCDVRGAPGAQWPVLDFSISGSVFSWGGRGLDGFLSAGDDVRLIYNA